MAVHNDFGREAEEFIAKKYLKNGYKILERNWYFYPAEIDIIALRESTLAIVEVKARSDSDFEHPEKAVTNAKKRRLIAAADAYIQEKGLMVDCRFDIAVVYKNNNTLISKMFIDAFLPHEI